jgi:hypothetical protein
MKHKPHKPPVPRPAMETVRHAVIYLLRDKTLVVTATSST